MPGEYDENDQPLGSQPQNRTMGLSTPAAWAKNFPSVQTAEPGGAPSDQTSENEHLNPATSNGMASAALPSIGATRQGATGGTETLMPSQSGARWVGGVSNPPPANNMNGQISRDPGGQTRQVSMNPIAIPGRDAGGMPTGPIASAADNQAWYHNPTNGKLQDGVNDQRMLDANVGTGGAQWPKTEVTTPQQARSIALTFGDPGTGTGVSTPSSSVAWNRPHTAIPLEPSPTSTPTLTPNTAKNDINSRGPAPASAPDSTRPPLVGAFGQPNLTEIGKRAVGTVGPFGPGSGRSFLDPSPAKPSPGLAHDDTQMPPNPANNLAWLRPPVATGSKLAQPSPYANSTAQWLKGLTRRLTPQPRTGAVAINSPKLQLGQ